MVAEGNGTASATEFRIEEALYSGTLPENGESAWLDKSQPAGHEPENIANGSEAPFLLAPIVDKIAHGIAKGLVAAIKELELHIAGETRRVADDFGRRIDTLEAGLDEVTKVSDEQKSASDATREHLGQLTADITGLRETDTHHAAELERLGTEARDLSTSVWERIHSTAASLGEHEARRAAELETLSAGINDRTNSITQRIDELCSRMGVHQEDIASLKGPVHDFGPRLDALVARMDRHAEVFRLTHAAVSQQDEELEQIMNGLARMKSHRISLENNEL